MDLSCPTCAFTTTIPDGQLPPEGTRARCPNCGRVSVFLRGGLVDDQPTPPHGMDAVSARPAAYRAQPERSAAAPRTSGWRIRSVAGEEGPYELDKVKNMIRTGSLHPDDEVVPPDEPEWRRAGDIPELARYFKLKQQAGGAAAAPAATAGAAPCFMHPSRPCAFHCVSCGTLSCAECVVERELRMLKVKLCPRCDKPVQPWVPSKVIVPFWKEIPKLLAYPVSGLAILGPIICAMLGAGAAIGATVGSLYGWFAFFFLMACITAFHLMIIQHTVKGGRRVPDLSSLEDVWREMVWPGARAAFVTFLVFFAPGYWQGAQVAPLEAEVEAREMTVDMTKQDREAFERGDLSSDESADQGGWGDDDGGPADEPTQEEAARALDSLMAQSAVGDVALPGLSYHEEPRDLEYYAEQERIAKRDLADAESRLITREIVGWLLVLVAFVMWPIVLIVVALFNTVMPALQPAVLVRVIGEIPKEYGYCVVAATACYFAAELVTLPLRGVPILGGLASNPATYYFSFIAFHVMGRTAEMAEQKIDWS